MFEKETNKIDKNLKKIDQFIGPRAKQLYFERKVDLENVIEMKKIDDDNIEKENIHI